MFLVILLKIAHQKLVIVGTQPLGNTSNWITMLIKEKKRKPQGIQEVIYKLALRLTDWV